MAGSITPDKNPLSSPTTSRSATETVNGSHKFMIQGYSLAKGIGVGKYIGSDLFIVGGHQWAIYFYPNGKNPEDNSAYVSVFIALASDGADVRALFELTLLDQSRLGKHKVHSHFDRTLESGPYTLKGSMWFVADRSPNWSNTLKEYFDVTPSVAVGEIGVDKGSHGRQIDFSERAPGLLVSLYIQMLLLIMGYVH